MSSFINSAEHFNSVENALAELTYKQGFYVPYSLKQIAPKFYAKQHYSFETVRDEIKGIIDTLKELQVVCVTLQYKHHYEGVLDKEIETQMNLVKIKSNIEGLSLCGIVKALNCIDYQIEVEHLKELRELTNEEQNALTFVREMVNALNMHIVSDLPEYESAKYCIE